MKYLLPFFLLFAATAHGQRLRRFTTYFDSTKTLKREVFSAIVAGDTVPQGTYRRFYRNGRLEQQTSFNAGRRDSAYVEFHPTGARRLETTYRDGTRQGPFKTYYPTGKVAQEGQFENDEPSGELTYYHPSGEVKLRTSLRRGQPNGPLKSLYADGRTQAEITYIEGKPNGPVRFFYPDGQLQSEGVFQRGLLAGPYKTYYPNGQIETEVQADKTGKGRYLSYYASGKLQTEGTYAPAPLVQRPVKNPLGDDLTKRVAPPIGTASLNGPATSYYESGQVKSRLTYRMGVPTGKGVEYFLNGNVREETEYGNGGRDRKITRYYDAPGKLKESEEQFKNNRPTGTWRAYYADGKSPRKTETYGPAGRLLGDRTQYYENGQVQSRQPYVNGLLIGVGQEFYNTGKLRKEATYAHNLLSGPFKELREDGTLTVSGQYKNGKQHGVWTYYKEDGQTAERTVTYSNGRLLPAGGATRPTTKPRPPLKRK